MRKLTEEYSADGRWLFIRVGKHAIPDSASERVLDGNYGVLYDINLTLSNPTSDTKNVKVMFDPTAGIAGVASIIDGQFYGKSHVVGTRELPLASFRLSPGERRQVRVNTLPLATRCQFYDLAGLDRTGMNCPSNTGLPLATKAR